MPSAPRDAFKATVLWSMLGAFGGGSGFPAKQRVSAPGPLASSVRCFCRHEACTGRLCHCRELGRACQCGFSHRKSVLISSRPRQCTPMSRARAFFRGPQKERPLPGSRSSNLSSASRSNPKPGRSASTPSSSGNSKSRHPSSSKSSQAGSSSGAGLFRFMAAPQNGNGSFNVKSVARSWRATWLPDGLSCAARLVGHCPSSPRSPSQSPSSTPLP